MSIMMMGTPCCICGLMTPIEIHYGTMVSRATCEMCRKKEGHEMNKVSEEVKDNLREGIRSLGMARSRMEDFDFSDPRRWMTVANFHLQKVAIVIKMNGEANEGKSRD